MNRAANDPFAATAWQRTVIAAIAGALLAFCVATLQETYRLSPRALDAMGQGGRSGTARAFDLFLFAACAETLIAFISFCGLTIVWAIFQPVWAGRAFNFVGKHVWHVLMLFILGFVVLICVLLANNQR